MCGKPSKPKTPPPPVPDPTIADRGAETAVDASLGRRVGALDETRPGTLGGGAGPAGGPTSSVLGG